MFVYLLPSFIPSFIKKSSVSSLKRREFLLKGWIKHDSGFGEEHAVNGDPHSFLKRWQETSVNALIFKKKIEQMWKFELWNVLFRHEAPRCAPNSLSTLLGRNVGTSRCHFKHSQAHLRQIVSANIPAQNPKALLPFMAAPCVEALGRKAL